MDPTFRIRATWSTRWGINSSLVTSRFSRDNRGRRPHGKDESLFLSRINHLPKGETSWNYLKVFQLQTPKDPFDEVCDELVICNKDKSSSNLFGRIKEADDIPVILMLYSPNGEHGNNNTYGTLQSWNNWTMSQRLLNSNDQWIWSELCYIRYKRLAEFYE